MDFKELEELIRIFEDSGLSEIEVEEEGRRMRLQKSGPHPPPGYAYSYAPPQNNPAAPPAQSGNQGSEQDSGADEEYADTIDSPMVGTFYAAPAPGEPPFVKPGDRVDENQTVCIVEAMKLMNEVGAKVSCTIEKVLVENGEPVEFGQPLFAITPID